MKQVHKTQAKQGKEMEEMQKENAIMKKQMITTHFHI